ncbi:MAG: hypothetical protein ACRD9S_09120 [Pyrinomonadaceae bacterium]
MITRKGLIFSVDGRYPWSQTHAQIPSPDLLPNGRIRIYYSTRDSLNRSLTSFIEVSADNPQKILYEHNKPILEFGSLGCFDDCGVMPSSVVTHDEKKYLYYCGWNTSTTVRYRNCIGLAVSEDGGATFERAFAGPILDRTKDEPHLVVTPHVIIEDGIWKMWYCGGTEWKIVNGVTEPQYLIKYAESADGIDWRRDNRVLIPYKDENEAIGRPVVVHESGLYKMWYSYRSIADYRHNRERSYRIGYAESKDNVKWERKDEQVGIELADEGWDSEMMAYPYIVDYEDKRYLFYNGNGFGRSGFGYAVLE